MTCSDAEKDLQEIREVLGEYHGEASWAEQVDMRLREAYESGMAVGEYHSKYDHYRWKFSAEALAEVVAWFVNNSDVYPSGVPFMDQPEFWARWGWDQEAIPKESRMDGFIFPFIDEDEPITFE